MKIMINYRISIISAVLLISIFYYGEKYAIALQPYQNNFEKYYVRQGPGQCGPAALYIIFKYYGDHERKDITYYKGPDVNMQNSERRMLNIKLQIPSSSRRRLTRDSGIAAWINGSERSTDWAEMVGAVENLYYSRDGHNFIKYYSVIKTGGYTDSGKSGVKERYRRFMDIIYPRFLSKSRPVVIHLKRMWPFPGHYLVIAGFDRDGGQVKYTDPNTEYGDNIIKKIDLDDFIKEKWYQSPSYPWWYPAARWDGRWLGFYRE